MMSDKKPILRVRNISKSFGDSTILSAVSLTLVKGEIKVLDRTFRGRQKHLAAMH